jgi:rod shape-determining protein MreC
MRLGTLDRTPPPFFRQGPSALTKLTVCAALALFLMVADSRFAFVVPLRAGLAAVLLPVQRALMAPIDLLTGGGDYLRGLQQAQSGEAQARKDLAALSEHAHSAVALAAENAQLRGLLALGPALPVRSLAAEVMFEARDPYSRKLLIDRGQAQGVQLGAPVIDPDGVIGQVTRVYPLSAEVTLVIDKDAAVPVLNRRTRQRSAAYGGAQGPDGAMMELRFLSANADVKEGDVLETGGLDGVYPPGLPVGRVVSVERRVEGGFARILVAAAAPADGVRHVLLLEPSALQRPLPVAAAASAASTSASRARR